MDLMNAHLYLLYHHDGHNRLATRTGPIFSYNQLFVNNRNMQVYKTIIHREKKKNIIYLCAALRKLCRAIGAAHLVKLSIKKKITIAAT